MRVVREDPARKGLLYAGTEFGLYVSFDDGAHWQSLQLNLPLTPVTDIMIYRDDLIVTTQGRGFWILDNMSRSRAAWRTAQEQPAAMLFKPEDAYRARRSGADVLLLVPRRADRARHGRSDERAGAA